MADAQRNRTIVLISLVTIAASLVVILGWIFHIPALQTVLPAFEAMRFNTAICFVLSGGALLSTQYNTGKYPLLFHILSSLVTLIALITLFQNVFNFNTGLDQLFVKDGSVLDKTYPFPGRMSVNSDICFLLLGTGLLILALKRGVLNIVAQFLFHIVTILSSIAIIGYVYRASFFYELSSAGPMAVQTVVLFFFMSISASLLHPSIGITNLFTGQLVGNKMARRVFTLIIFIVLTIGTLRIRSQHYYQFSVELWVALVTVCFLLICLLVIWNTATWLNGIDLKRSEAEEEIRVMNNELEEIVEKRTIEFQKSEEKYRLLIEHASDAIYVVDLNGDITDVNESMCTMTGYSREELLKLNVEALVDPEELKVDPIKHGPRTGVGATVRERRFIRKDGSLFDAEISVKMFADDKVLIMARDITDRKKMEAGLKQAELKFRTLADQSMVGVYISQKERFTYVNPRFAEIFGFEPHELVNTSTSPIEMIISEDYRATVRENVRKRLEEEVASIHYEVMGLKKDGSTNWIEFYGNRVLIDGHPTIIGSMLDITERKIAEELMLREKALSDAIINSLPGVFYLRKEKGEYLRWNKNFETVTGYTSEEIKKISIKDLIVKADQEKVMEANEKAFKEGYATVEIKAVTKDGTKIPYLLSIAPLMYENELCLLGTGIDISSRIRAQEELISSEQKYKLLFESNPVPLWMIAKDDMTIIAVNDTAANLYGYSKEELLNNSAKIMRPKEDLDKQREGYRRDVNTSTDIGVVRHLKKDGTVMFIQIIAHDIIFDGRPVRLSLTNDITEKLKAEESLQKSEANLQAILKTTDTAYALLDMELKVLEFNQMATQFVREQYHHEVKKGDRLADYFPKERLPQFAGFAKEVLAGKNVSYEVDYLQPNGAVYWFYVRLFPITNDNNEILGLMMALYDITERKNAEQDLKNAYERIQSHINSIKDMAWKQSHLMRSPLANLKALSELLKDHPTDIETLDHFRAELDRMDAIIHEMAKDASEHDD